MIRPPLRTQLEAILMAVSEAIENYLETIYILSQQQNEVHAIDICSYLSYSRPTVSLPTSTNAIPSSASCS